MKKFLFLPLLGLLALLLHPSILPKDTAAVAGPSENLQSSHTSKMTGTVHFSFEQAEFVSRGIHYFINESHGLLNKIKDERKYSGAYNVTLDNICVYGRVLDRQHNKGNDFGPLGRYEQAVIIEGLC